MSFVSRFAASVTATGVVLFLAIGELAWAAPQGGELVRVEVFTGQELPVQVAGRNDVLPVPTSITVYELDKIAKLEAMLSESLPADPDAARKIVLTRVGQIDSPWIEAAQRAAVGLVRAAEYGIDRYPAIVFNGHAVVYGVADLGEALRHYRVWLGRAPR